MTIIEKVIYALNAIPNQKRVGPNGESTYDLVKELEEYLEKNYLILEYKTALNGQLPLNHPNQSQGWKKTYVPQGIGGMSITEHIERTTNDFVLELRTYNVNAQETDKEDLKKFMVSFIYRYSSDSIEVLAKNETEAINIVSVKYPTLSRSLMTAVTKEYYDSIDSSDD